MKQPVAACNAAAAQPGCTCAKCMHLSKDLPAYPAEAGAKRLQPIELHAQDCSAVYMILLCYEDDTPTRALLISERTTAQYLQVLDDCVMH